MLRSILIYLSKAVWARNIMTKWSFSWRVASRFVAGDKQEDAINAITDLNSKGINATLDHLGENVTNLDEASAATQEIIEMLERIERARVVAGVSVKLSQIGILLSESLCEENLRKILEKAKELKNFVRIDMEDSPFTEVTLKLFRRMIQAGYKDTVGVVIQAYLYRSEEDVKRLMKEGARVRLCKGAYKEPPDIAFPKKSEVDQNFDQIVKILLDGALQNGSIKISPDGKIPPIPAIGTHDQNRIEYTKQYVDKIGLSKDALEFQMLYGIRRDLQEQLAKQGYPVRVYVPYGTEWYPYFVRRLAERPANLWFFLTNFVKK